MDRGGLIIILSCYFIGQYIIYTGCCLVHVVHDAVIKLYENIILNKHIHTTLLALNNPDLFLGSSVCQSR